MGVGRNLRICPTGTTGKILGRCQEGIQGQPMLFKKVRLKVEMRMKMGPAQED